jgi:hypothetical protein
MPNVKAGPNEFLLVGRGGTLENRGSAVQTFLWPGTIWVLVPSTKQEATFEFTQETRDGIPLRFKGIVIYRITDPIAAARTFDFTPGPEHGIGQINTLLTHVCLGELRDAVSHMSMTECIEQRKSGLSEVVRAAAESTIRDGDAELGWGISVEVAQLAQVFIVDAELRARLEAEVRNEIKLKSDRSDIRAGQEAQLAEMAAADRVAEQQLAADREALRRREALFASELAATEARVTAETPVRLLALAREAEVLREELEVQALRNGHREGQVEHELAQRRAEQALRREILPLEQAPQLAEAASGIFQGANLSLYGDGAQLVAQVAPLLELLARSVRGAAPGDPA